MGRWEDGFGRVEGQKGSMNGWLNRAMDGECVSGCLHRQMDISMVEWSDGQIHRNIWVGGLMDGSVAWGIGGWVDLEGRGNRQEEAKKGCSPGGAGPWSSSQRRDRNYSRGGSFSEKQQEWLVLSRLQGRLAQPKVTPALLAPFTLTVGRGP